MESTLQCLYNYGPINNNCSILTFSLKTSKRIGTQGQKELDERLRIRYELLGNPEDKSLKGNGNEARIVTRLRCSALKSLTVTL